jgi:hypothetical protein
MARFYADEDFPGPVVEKLRDLGHDVLTVQEAGRQGGGDDKVLADATADNRAVLTHNRRHFKRLHKNHRHAGIVACTRDDDDMPGLAQRIHDAVSATPDLADQYIRIIRPNPQTKP